MPTDRSREAEEKSAVKVEEVAEIKAEPEPVPVMIVTSTPIKSALATKSLSPGNRKAGDKAPPKLHAEK